MSLSDVVKMYYLHASSELYNFARLGVDALVQELLDILIQWAGVVPEKLCPGGGRSLTKTGGHGGSPVVYAVALYFMNAIASDLDGHHSCCRNSDGGLNNEALSAADVDMLSALGIVSKDGSENDELAELWGRDEFDPYNPKSLNPRLMDFFADGRSSLVPDTVTIMQIVHAVCHDSVVEFLAADVWTQLRSRLHLPEPLRVATEEEIKRAIESKLAGLGPGDERRHGLHVAHTEAKITNTVILDSEMIAAKASAVAQEINTAMLNSAVSRFETEPNNLSQRYLCQQLTDSLWLDVDFRDEMLDGPADILQPFLDRHGCSDAIRLRDQHRARIAAAISAAGIAPGTMAWFTNVCKMWDKTIDDSIAAQQRTAADRDAPLVDPVAAAAATARVDV